MSTPSSIAHIVPVLSSADIQRDLRWYEKHTGFTTYFDHNDYAGMRRGTLEFHLQWHHNNADDPVYPGVMKLFVEDILPYVDEFVERGTIQREKLRMNTPWGTHEFGFYDLNNNAIFIMQDA